MTSACSLSRNMAYQYHVGISGVTKHRLKGKNGGNDMAFWMLTDKLAAIAASDQMETSCAAIEEAAGATKVRLDELWGPTSDHSDHILCPCRPAVTACCQTWPAWRERWPGLSTGTWWTMAAGWRTVRRRS